MSVFVECKYHVNHACDSSSYGEKIKTTLNNESESKTARVKTTTTT